MLYQFEILFLTDVAITPTQKKVQYIHHHLTHINTADQKRSVELQAVGFYKFTQLTISLYFKRVMMFWKILPLILPDPSRNGWWPSLPLRWPSILVQDWKKHKQLD